ncbi:MAG TPA: GNAT family N-acetyltransferase [Stellaceae bacterium]|nr:GNAT family N-acetyltransferase [Stellaceae bacterium]
MAPASPKIGACSIRPARIEEADALSDLCARSKAVWGYDRGFMTLARPALAIAPDEVARGAVWVAVLGGRIVGGVTLTPGEVPGTLDLGKLFVRPRRLRSGIGRALLAHAVEEARRRGAARLTILADPNAAGFYEREGARRIGDAPSGAVPGRFLPLYEISLAPA